jgi:hypothetical protein
MNAASQLLRVLAILGAIAAGVLFYLSNGKIAGLKSDLDTANNTAATAKSNADKAIADAQTQLATDAQTLADMRKQLSSSKANEDTANARFQAQMEDSNAKDDAIAAANKKAADAAAKVDDLQSQVNTIPDLQSQITDLKTQLKTATDTIAQLQANPSTGTTTSPVSGNITANGTVKNSNPTTSVAVIPMPTVPKNLSPAQPATLLQSDSRNWLLLLDIGTGTGVAEGTSLYLKVGDDNLAIVQVTSLNGSHATAAITSTEDIAPNKFFGIAKQGLHVTYQTEAK